MRLRAVAELGQPCPSSFLCFLCVQLRRAVFDCVEEGWKRIGGLWQAERRFHLHAGSGALNRGVPDLWSTTTTIPGLRRHGSG